MKHFSHLNTAVQLIRLYKGEMPFSIYLRSFFSQHKKYGSKDRKSISHLCYCCFRLGRSLDNVPADEKILAGLFLCDTQPGEFLQSIRPSWNDAIGLTLEEKINKLKDHGFAFSPENIFPWKDLLSDGVDHVAFCRSFLVQPDLFIRVRPGHGDNVRGKLTTGGITFSEVLPGCLSLPNASRIETLIDLDKEAVIQDLNSQLTGSFFSPNSSRGPGTTLNVWDCCAASGGKSILAVDVLNGPHLTVSDIRESIIQNLKQRFARAGVKNYDAFVADLSKNTPENIRSGGKSKKLQPDLIILDAPCSGSGTWARTPEQLAYFSPDRVDHYSRLQKSIASNVIQALRPGGRLVYITCSVFRNENEEAVNFLREKLALQPERMELLRGYDLKADTLFAASLVKS